MRSLKTLLVAGAMLVGVSAAADCCVQSCCHPAKCVKVVTKCVPYQECSVVCTPVYDACGNVVDYQKVKRCVTKFKTVKVKQEYCCCQCD